MTAYITYMGGATGAAELEKNIMAEFNLKAVLLELGRMQKAGLISFCEMINHGEILCEMDAHDTYCKANNIA